MLGYRLTASAATRKELTGSILNENQETLVLSLLEFTVGDYGSSRNITKNYIELFRIILNFS